MARYIYQGTFRDGLGRVVSSGTVSVYLENSSTAANVYTAASGGTAVNSVTSSSDGSFVFFVDYADYDADQHFKITLSKTDFTSKSYDYLSIFPELFVSAESPLDLNVATGDAYIQFSLADVNKWAFGMDDSDSDKFIIASGGALGTNNVLELGSGKKATFKGNLDVNATGEITCGSINRASGTMTLEIAGITEVSISSTTTTLAGNLLIPDAGTIGSATGTSAITIASTGIVTLVDDLILKDTATIGVTSSTSAITIASTGAVTLADDLTVTGNDIKNDTGTVLTMTTATVNAVFAGDLAVTGDLIVTGQSAAGATINADIQSYALAPDAQDTIYIGFGGYTLSDDTVNYGVVGQATGGGGATNAGVYGHGANAVTNNYHFLSSDGDNCSGGVWNDVSHSSKKRLIADLSESKYVELYNALEDLEHKSYRHIAEMPILGLDENKEAVHDDSNPTEAPERFGLTADGDKLPSFLRSADGGSLSGGRLANYALICIKHQKQVIEQFEARILALEKA